MSLESRWCAGCPDLFNVLAAASPEALAGDVVSLRGTPTTSRGLWARGSPARS